MEGADEDKPETEQPAKRKCTVVFCSKEISGLSRVLKMFEVSIQKLPCADLGNEQGISALSNDLSFPP